jgi:rubrerythrin
MILMCPYCLNIWESDERFGKCPNCGTEFKPTDGLWAVVLRW